MLRKRPVHEGVLTVEHVEHRAVALGDVREVAHRLLEHRLPEFVGKRGKTVAIDGVVLLEAAEVEPVAGELGGEAAHLRIAEQSASPSGLCKSPAAARASNSLSGWLDHKK